MSVVSPHISVQIVEFQQTNLDGAWVVRPQRHRDDRGFFARTWCHEEFSLHGLNPSVVQCNVSFNHACGTVRGMHFQTAPHEETKLVRCTMGKILDVIVDLRPDSATYLKHYALELNPERQEALYIPAGFAHGFQTLDDNTEVFYQMSTEYHAASAAGIRWDDPALDITWPLPISAISENDLSFPDYASMRGIG